MYPSDVARPCYAQTQIYTCFSYTAQPRAADSASLPGYVSWLQFQHQQAVRQLATMEAANVPAVHQYSASLPHHSDMCSPYPCGQERFQVAFQVYWPPPAIHNNSLQATQGACVCKNWNGMSFPIFGSSAECTGQMEGSVAGLRSTDRSLSLDNLAILAYQSILGASGHNSVEVRQLLDSC